jgi:hypothetical protein
MMLIPVYGRRRYVYLHKYQFMTGGVTACAHCALYAALVNVTLA